MLKKILLTLFASLILFSEAMSLPLFDIGIVFGLSTPNDQINNIYNSDLLKQEDMVVNLARDGARLGFHLGLAARIPLSEGFTLRAGFAWHRFPETDIKIFDPQSTIPNEFAYLSTTQDVFPITAGLNYELFNIGIFSCYGAGELAYYHFSNEVDYDCSVMCALPNLKEVNIDKSPSYNRVGFGLGIGFDFNLVATKINLETRYNMTNLIGQDDDEKIKDFLSLTLGIYL